MKIVVCHEFNQRASGTDRLVRDEERLLKSHGHQIVRFTPCNAKTRKQTLAELRDCVVNKRANLVHFHRTPTPDWPTLHHVARSAGAAVVQSIHDYRMICSSGKLFRNGETCERCVGKWFPWPAVWNGCGHEGRLVSALSVAKLAANRLRGTFSNIVDRYITMTGFTRQKLIDSGLPPHKIDVKPNSISGNSNIGRGRGGYAMFLGRLSTEKGVDVLLRAWEQIGDAVPLKVVGNGPMSNVVAQAARENSRIEWLAAQSDTEVEQLIADAKFLIIPTVSHECFPRVIVESFSKGTPIVASRLGALAEVIADGRTGMHFQPGSAEDLAKTVLHLFRDDWRLEMMRREARLEFTKRYTAELNFQMLIGVYEQALETRKAETIPQPQSDTVTNPISRWLENTSTPQAGATREQAN